MERNQRIKLDPVVLGNKSSNPLHFIISVHNLQTVLNTFSMVLIKGNSLYSSAS